MEEVKDSIKQNATDMFYNQIVDLQSLVRAIEVTKEKDLQWLLQKSLHLLSGGVAGCVSRSAVAPIERIIILR